MTDPIHEQCGYEVSTSGQPLTEFQRGQVAAYQHARMLVREQANQLYSAAVLSALADAVVSIDAARHRIQSGKQIDAASEPQNKAEETSESIRAKFERGTVEGSRKFVHVENLRRELFVANGELDKAKKE